MLFIQLYEINSAADKIGSAINQENFTERTNAVSESFAKLEKSNHDVFNMLLPMLGAWVGAVVAYYFGSKNLDKAYETFSDVSKSHSDKKILEIINEIVTKHPDSMEIAKVKLNDKLKDVEKSLKEYGNVVVVDDKEKPLGVLYKEDLSDYRLNHISDWQDKKLEEIINTPDELKDSISGKSWTKDGVRNFATLTLQDSVQDAISKLDAIKSKNPDVRGIIMTVNKMIGIVNFSILHER